MREREAVEGYNKGGGGGVLTRGGGGGGGLVIRVGKTTLLFFGKSMT